MTADYHQCPWASLRQGLTAPRGAALGMRLLRWLLFVLLLAAAARRRGCGAGSDQPLPLASPTVELSIEPGATPREVAHRVGARGRSCAAACCCTSGSAGPAMRDASAPAAMSLGPR